MPSYLFVSNYTRKHLESIWFPGLHIDSERSWSKSLFHILVARKLKESNSCFVDCFTLVPNCALPDCGKSFSHENACFAGYRFPVCAICGPKQDAVLNDKHFRKYPAQECSIMRNDPVYAKDRWHNYMYVRLSVLRLTDVFLRHAPFSWRK